MVDVYPELKHYFPFGSVAGLTGFGDLGLRFGGILGAGEVLVLFSPSSFGACGPFPTGKSGSIRCARYTNSSALKPTCDCRTTFSSRGPARVASVIVFPSFELIALSHLSLAECSWNPTTSNNPAGLPKKFPV